MKALIIDEPWIGLILKGEKTWEMRTRRCKFRGLIALVRKGSGHVVGVAQLVDCLAPLETPKAYAEAEVFHRIPPQEQALSFAGGWRIPWVLAEVRPLVRPVHYQHPHGAVIWVNIAPETAAQVRAEAR